MDKGNKPNLLLWVLGGIAVAAFIFVLERYINNFKTFPIANDSATWGTFGDYLGGTLNPIISFLALIGLLYTIHQQAQEMQATREELKQAAEQQRQQVEQQSRQSEIFNLQQFESTFFSLLEQHNKIIEKIMMPIEAKRDSINNTGSIKNNNIMSLSIKHDVIMLIRNSYLHSFSDINKKNDFIVSTYHIANEIRSNHELRRYFITLFQILKFISIHLSNDKNKIKNLEIFATNNQESRKYLSEENLAPREKIYSNIVRASIPNEILHLLALNCLTMDKYSEAQGFRTFYNFQGLLNRYNFLEHLQLDKTDIVDVTSLGFNILWLFLAINIEDIRTAFGNSNLLEEIGKLITKESANKTILEIEEITSKLEETKNEYQINIKSIDDKKLKLKSISPEEYINLSDTEKESSIPGYKNYKNESLPFELWSKKHIEYLNKYQQISRETLNKIDNSIIALQEIKDLLQNPKNQSN